MPTARPKRRGLTGTFSGRAPACLDGDEELFYGLEPEDHRGGAPLRTCLTRWVSKSTTSSSLMRAVQSRWNALTAARRLVLTALVGVAVTAISGVFGAWQYAALIGWDAAVVTFSSLTWAGIAPMDAKATAEYARREDPTGPITDALLLGASVASLVAVGVVLVAASSARPVTRGMLAGLAVASVALSWLLVHTLFTLRYARLYQLTGGGVDFNQDSPPRYLDFAYLAFTIGMTFQVSDTNLKTTTIRSAALKHALLSYLLGTVILGATINFIVGLS